MILGSSALTLGRQSIVLSKEEIRNVRVVFSVFGRVCMLEVQGSSFNGIVTICCQYLQKDQTLENSVQTLRVCTELQRKLKLELKLLLLSKAEKAKCLRLAVRAEGCYT